MYRISRQDTHLLVELHVITRDVVAAAASTLLDRPDYATTNDIWDGTAAPVLLAQEDLDDLVAGIAARYPRTATRTRTALVVRGGFATAVAELWQQAASRLPYETAVFASRRQAEAWVQEGAASPPRRSIDTPSCPRQAR
jgi:hypothetical protein